MATDGSLSRRSRPYPLANLVGLSLFLFPITLLGCGDGNPDFTPEELAQATEQVRDAYYAQDNHYGVELGDRWIARAPEALELRAWTIANLMLTRLEGDEAKKRAEEMVASHPDSPWSWFALAHTIAWEYPYRNGEEAMAASDKVLAGLPGNLDAGILRAELLLRYGDEDPYGPGARGAAKAFLDASPEEISKHPDIRAFLAYRLGPPARERTEADTEAMIRTYEGILAEEPDHLLATYYLGSMLRGIEGEEERARTYLERATALSPSPLPLFRLVQDIVEDPDLDAEGRRSEVAANIRQLLEEFLESPGRWADIASSLGFFGFPGVQRELEERVLTEHPNSWGAEMVLTTRLSLNAYEFNNERPASEEKSAEESEELESLAKALLAMPEHRNPGGPKEAYWTLFLLEKEKPNADYTLLSELAETWAGTLNQASDVWADQKAILGALALAQHSETLNSAKTLLSAGQGEMGRFAADLEFQRPTLTERSIGVREDHVRASEAYLSIASALILAQEGSFQEAETALSQARDFDPEDDDAWTVFPLADFVSGKIKELRADDARERGDEAAGQRFLASAEDFYVHGMQGDYYPRPGYAVGWTNPNETGLRDLYDERQGSLEGFERYLASAREGGWEKRRAEILASRMPDPQPIEPVALDNLDGEAVTSESYMGRVVVINFWGTW